MQRDDRGTQQGDRKPEIFAMPEEAFNPDIRLPRFSSFHISSVPGYPPGLSGSP
jgi:hypothetical protein